MSFEENLEDPGEWEKVDTDDSSSVENKQEEAEEPKPQEEKPVEEESNPQDEDSSNESETAESTESEESSENQESSFNIDSLPEEQKNGINDFLVEATGGVVEDIQEVSELVSQFSEMHTENETLKKQIEDGIKPVYQNDYAKGLDDFMAKGGDPMFYHRAQGIDITQLKPDEAIKLNMLWSNPSLSQSQVDALFNKKYMVGVEKTDENKIDVEATEAQMTIDSSKATESLKSLQATYEVPSLEKQSVENEAAETERINSWGNFSEDVDLEGTMEFQVGEKSDNQFKFSLPEDGMSWVREHIQEVIGLSGLDNTPENQEKLVDSAIRSYLSENLETVVSNSYIAGQSAKEKEYLDNAENPTKVVPADQNEEETEESMQDWLFDKSMGN